MYYYSVLLPLAVNGFIYKSEYAIEPGSRVSVNFVGRRRIGVVEETSDINSLKEIKKIESVIDEKPILTAELIKTINFVSFYYLCPKGLVLKYALPSAVFTKEKIDFTKKLYQKIIYEKFYTLNDEQASIYKSINLNSYSVNLMFGITGSGKTEVFLHLIKDVIENGKNALVLVPEIALTNQYKRFFEEKFADSVAVFHSQLTPNQKFQEWLDYRLLRKRVLLGTRSATFVDLSDTGLVVVDEENDDSYKQENTPAYNAKDILIYRAKQLNIPVILSSATPTVETYYKATLANKFNIFRLNKRINNVSLPTIKFAQKNRGILSEYSMQQISELLNQKQATAILVNRRGFSHYLACGDCGYIFRCPNCNVSLVYHKKSKDLKCHFCESSYPIPTKCPNCLSYNIRDIGMGTQKMEEFLKKQFKNVTIERLDRDICTSKKNIYSITKDLMDGKIDIIVGTSMISKGYDIEKIKLVIISNIESILALPDFRVDEKVMSLIVQTAGRSGRRSQGSVIIESKLPQRLEPFILNTDYEGFLQQELQIRQTLSYPPFSHIVRIDSSHAREDIALQDIQDAANILKKEGGFDFLGPSKCPIDKIRNKWHYHIIIKSKSIFTTIQFIAQNLHHTSLHFDVDPISFF